MRFRQGSQLSAHKRIHLAIRKFTTRPNIEAVKLTSLLQQNPEALHEDYRVKGQVEFEVNLPLIQEDQEQKFSLPNILY